MAPQTYIHQSLLPASAEEAFAWHARPGALERLTPPWEKVRVVSRTGGISEGDRVVLRLCVGPVPVTWVAEHRDFQPPERFRDVQIRGPFSSWDHLHRFEPLTPDQCRLEDRIEYTIPGGVVGRMLGGAFLRRKLERMFNYRHATTAADLAAHANDRQAPWEVCVSGASGLIGSALVPFLTAGGHRVRRLVRGQNPSDPDSISWNPDQGILEPDKLEGCQAVVHLAGENIAAGRWTTSRKARILASRAKATRVLCESLSRLQAPPQVLVCASATGFYGDRPDATLDEDAEPGEGFLAQVCREWETAAEPAVDRGIRVVFARFGVVLSPRGGALRKMLPVFRVGIGGRLGSGQQFWSWISLDDAIGAIHHAIITPSLAGAVNVTTSNPVRNAEFTQVLAKVLRRPAILPVPAFVLKKALGEMADEMLLASARVLPRRLYASGYEFRHPTLEVALRHLLGHS